MLEPISTPILDARVFDSKADPEATRAASRALAELFLDSLHKEFQAQSLDSGKGHLIPPLKETICFLDVVVSTPTERNQGFVVVPHDDAFPTAKHPYCQAVNVMLRKNRSVGDHPVFLAGLPGDRRGKVRTPAELTRFLADMSAGPTSLMVHPFVARIDPPPATEASDPPPPRRLVYDSLRYVESSKYDVSENKWGPDSQDVYSNLATFKKAIEERRAGITDCKGRPLRIIMAIPVATYVRVSDSPAGAGGVTALNLGSCFIGLSDPWSGLPDLPEEFLTLLRRLIVEHVGISVRHTMDTSAGGKKQQISFAHQTSSVIDAILERVGRLPEDVRGRMGGLLLAKLHLLRATIHSYRSRSSRFDPGPFPYPWSEDPRPPLEIYRDLSIQIGMARALDAKEAVVKNYAHDSLPACEDPHSPAFEPLRDLFEPVPAVSPAIERRLKHSSFATLILLSLKQAIYHTLRARIHGGQSEARVCIRVVEGPESIRLVCSIHNPAVPNDDWGQKSRDAEELKELALRLSNVGEKPSTYEVDGPGYSEADHAYVTTTTITFTPEPNP